MNATIQGVREPKAWVKDGQLKGHFINGVFDDGREWSVLVMGQLPAAEEAANQLKELIGKPSEFTAEERTTPNGSKQWSIKNWPGKPQQGGGFKGGGGRGWSEAYSQSKEAFEIQQRSIQRSVALDHAIKWAATAAQRPSTTDLLTCANKFFSWLSNSPTPAPAATVSAPAPQPRYEEEDVLTPF